MPALEFCRACLASDVRMYRIQALCGYEKKIENLLKFKLVTDRGKDSICYICYSLINKLDEFVAMVQNSEKLLNFYISQSIEITVERLNVINTIKPKYSVTRLNSTSTKLFPKPVELPDLKIVLKDENKTKSVTSNVDDEVTTYVDSTLQDSMTSDNLNAKSSANSIRRTLSNDNSFGNESNISNSSLDLSTTEKVSLITIYFDKPNEDTGLKTLPMEKKVELHNSTEPQKNSNNSETLTQTNNSSNTAVSNTMNESQVVNNNILHDKMGYLDIHVTPPELNAIINDTWNIPIKRERSNSEETLNINNDNDIEISKNNTPNKTSAINTSTVQDANILEVPFDEEKDCIILEKNVPSIVIDEDSCGLEDGEIKTENLNTSKETDNELARLKQWRDNILKKMYTEKNGQSVATNDIPKKKKNRRRRQRRKKTVATPLQSLLENISSDEDMSLLEQEPVIERDKCSKSNNEPEVLKLDEDVNAYNQNASKVPKTTKRNNRHLLKLQNSEIHRADTLLPNEHSILDTDDYNDCDLNYTPTTHSTAPDEVNPDLDKVSPILTDDSVEVLDCEGEMSTPKRKRRRRTGICFPKPVQIDEIFCHYCSASFLTRRRAMYHTRKSHPQYEIYPCTLCVDFFGTLDTLKVHLQEVHPPT